MREVWKPVPGFRHTEASSLGNIRHKKTIKKLFPTRLGYVRCNLLGGSFSVHSLVALAFHGPRPDGHHTDHINSIRDDNRPKNLRYITARQNVTKESVLSGKNVGVDYEKRRGKFRARIQIEGKTVLLGYFLNPKHARNAYLERLAELNN